MDENSYMGKNILAVFFILAIQHAEVRQIQSPEAHSQIYYKIKTRPNSCVSNEHDRTIDTTKET